MRIQLRILLPKPPGMIILFNRFGDLPGHNVTMSGWIKSATAFIKTLVAPWSGRSQPIAPNKTEFGTAANDFAAGAEDMVPGAEDMASGAEDLAPGVKELASGADRIEVRPESRISFKTEGLPNEQEIERRRGIVREYFNDFWTSVDDKPASFAERLNKAEGYINERMAARGEAWQLDAATRKQLGLPPTKARLG